MQKIKLAMIMALALFLTRCENGEKLGTAPVVGFENPGEMPAPGDTSGTGGTLDPNQWLVSPVYDGGPGKDGIPALQGVPMINASQVSYLKESDLVVGVVVGNQSKAYPHVILDWHEIVNDVVGNIRAAITYCPLTGTAIGFDRVINNQETTFGVSGLLYENNLVPYDRATDSRWSQMLMKSVHGQRIGTLARFVRVIETTWGTWKRMFPNTLVLSNNTGYSRPYGSYPYLIGGRDYRTDNNLILFPIGFNDGRLGRKDRVHGVIVNGRTKVYPFKNLVGRRVVLNDAVNGQPVVVAVSEPDNLILSYDRTVGGAELTFEVVTDTPAIYPFNLRSDDGTVWNIMGEAISGVRMGQKLKPSVSYNSFWFAWGSFFRGAEIYGQ